MTTAGENGKAGPSGSQQSANEEKPGGLKLRCTACCEESDSLLKCSRCKKARYCSKACQQAHWKAHKADCHATVQARERASNSSGHTNRTPLATSGLQLPSDLAGVFGQDPDPLARENVDLMVEMEEAGMLVCMGKLDEAIAFLRRLRPRLRPELVSANRKAIWTLQEASDALRVQGSPDKALACLEEALQLGGRIDLEATDQDVWNEMARCHYSATTLLERGKPEQALRHVQDAIALYKRFRKPVPPWVFDSAARAARSLGRSEDADAFAALAETLQDLVVGDEPRRVAELMSLKVRALQRGGERGKRAAAAYVQEVIRAQEVHITGGDRRALVADALCARARTCKEAGEHEAALAGYRLVLAVLESGCLGAHVVLPNVYSVMAELSDAVGKRQDVLKYLLKEKAAWTALHGRRHERVAKAAINISGWFKHQGRRDEALTQLREAAELQDKMLGEGSAEAVSTYCDICEQLMLLNRGDEARRVALKAAAAREKVVGKTHRDSIRLRGIVFQTYIKPDVKLNDAVACLKGILPLVQDVRGDDTRRQALAGCLGALCMLGTSWGGLPADELQGFRDELSALLKGMRDVGSDPDESVVREVKRGDTAALEGRHEDALSARMRVKELLQTCERVGDPYPVIADAVCSIAESMLTLGRPAEARGWLEQVMQNLVMRAVQCTAPLLQLQGYARALRLLGEADLRLEQPLSAMASFKNAVSSLALIDSGFKLGFSHYLFAVACIAVDGPDTPAASTSVEQRRNQALDALRSAIAIFRQTGPGRDVALITGTRDPRDLLRSCHFLAALALRSLSQDSRAVSHLEQALLACPPQAGDGSECARIRLAARNLPDVIPDRVAILREMSSVMDALGRREEAHELRIEELAARGESSKADLLGSLQCMEALAKGYLDAACLREAVAMLKSAAEIRQQPEAQEEDATNFAACLNALEAALPEASAHDPDEWIEIKQTCIECRRGVLRERDANVARGLSALGLALLRKDRHTEGMQYVRDSLDIQKAVVGEDSPLFLQTLKGVVDSLKSVGRREDALAFEMQALVIEGNSWRQLPLTRTPDA